MKIYQVGDIIRWPGLKFVYGVIIAIDNIKDDPVVWIRRVDDLGDYSYHSCKVSEL